MSIFVWDTAPSKIFVWDTEVSKVFVWDTQVRPAWWTPWANTVVYYPLTANANDYSWNWYNATNNGGTFSEANWWYFSTDTSRITLPSMTIWQTFTISAWMKLPNWQPTWTEEFDFYYDWSYLHFTLLYGASATGINIYPWNWGSGAQTKQISATFWTWWNNIVLSKSWTTYSVYQNWTLLETFTSSYNPSIPWWYNTVEFPHTAWHTAGYSAYWYMKDYIIENVAWSSSDVQDYYNLVKSNYWL